MTRAELSSSVRASTRAARAASLQTTTYELAFERREMAGEANGRAQTLKRSRVVLFGDSLTQRSFDAPSGWGARVASASARCCDCFNRGYGGYTTKWCAKIVREVMGEHVEAYEKCALVVIMLGTNDAARRVSDAARARERAYVSIAEYRENMRVIAREALSVARVVCVMTPPVVDDAQRVRFQIERYGEAWVGSEFEDRRDEIGDYAQAVRELVREMNDEGIERGRELIVVDVHEATREAKERGVELFCDGVHLNDAGQTLVFDTLWPCVSSIFDALNDLPDYPYGHELRDIDGLDVTEEAVWAKHEERWNVARQNGCDSTRSSGVA